MYRFKQDGHHNLQKGHLELGTHLIGNYFTNLQKCFQSLYQKALAVFLGIDFAIPKVPCYVKWAHFGCLSGKKTPKFSRLIAPAIGYRY